MELFRDFLEKELEIRRKKNPRYSLRGYARSLNLSPALLSRILNRKHKLSYRTFSKIDQSLEIPFEIRTGILKELESEDSQRKRSNAKLREPMTVEDFSEISNWQSLAIMSLGTLEKNSNDPYWIAEKLEVSVEEARGFYSRLKGLGYITEENHSFKRTKKWLSVSPGISVKVIREYHKQTIQKAISSIDQKSIDERSIHGLAFPTNPEVMDEVNNEIRRFCNRISSISKKASGPKSVYHLSVQYFPLTQPVE